MQPTARFSLTTDVMFNRNCCFEELFEAEIIWLCQTFCVHHTLNCGTNKSKPAGPSGRAVEGVVLRPLACSDCEFESHREHGCLLGVLCFVRLR